MAVLSIGLTPIFPVIEVVPVAEIPDFDRITKLPAVPRFTAARPDGGDEKSSFWIKPVPLVSLMLQFRQFERVT